MTRVFGSQPTPPGGIRNEWRRTLRHIVYPKRPGHHSHQPGRYRREKCMALPIGFYR